MDGRVEAQMSDGSWSSICNTDFTNREAQVVCRMLGKAGGRVVQWQGQSSGSAALPALDRIKCKGTELRLARCAYTYSRQPLCDPSRLARVECKGEVPGACERVCLGGEGSWRCLPLAR